jgi:hypothetical protein
VGSDCASYSRGWEWLRSSPRALPDVGVDEGALKPSALSQMRRGDPEHFVQFAPDFLAFYRVAD